MSHNNKPRVVIIGAGFGGLYAARTLEKADVDVLLIDRNNFHTFTPLLYQVATSGLEPGEIAYPVRGIFRGKTNVRFMMGEVLAIDHVQKSVTVQTDGDTREEPYNYLIIAAGSVGSYFGMDSIAGHAFDLKSLSDSVALRNHILKNFERAAWSDDPAQVEALTTLVVVGGGPTGLETAGALYELYNHVLRKEYAYRPDMHARVILVEAAGSLLLAYPEGLRHAALRQLESLGVEVVLGCAVAGAVAGHVTLDDGRIIPTYTLVWSAGVKASPLAEALDVPLQRGGRVPVQPTLQVAERAGVYVAGDMAYLEDPDGKPYPMLIPVAKQQGILAARNIVRDLKAEASKLFKYNDRGIMATIGRNRAVAWIYNRVPLTGFIAWVAWLGLHLITLMGFRNRLNVFVNWVWNYLTYDRSVRLILEHTPREAEAVYERERDYGKIVIG
ncbi:MAG: NAD(P)/FAD-dependent oxidoreductase [Anaerolineae bacterium]|nr:NAD(P)/FAD-dependent oxidoreductase [Anaerolineae bacterium]